MRSPCLAQAMAEQLTLVAGDKRLIEYGLPVLLV